MASKLYTDPSESQPGFVRVPVELKPGKSTHMLTAAKTTISPFIYVISTAIAIIM